MQSSDLNDCWIYPLRTFASTGRARGRSRYLNHGTLALLDRTTAQMGKLKSLGRYPGFLLIILGATDQRAPAGFAPIAIGLGLMLIHLISIRATNTSVNPARSAGPAIFAGDGHWRSCGCSG